MSELRKAVTDWIEEQNSDGYEGALEDLLKHGCASGMVSGLITYSETCAFFEKHRAEISQLLGDTLSDTGLCVTELFTGWEVEDPLVVDTHNQNLLAWFAFEETANRIHAESE